MNTPLNLLDRRTFTALSCTLLLLSACKESSIQAQETASASTEPELQSEPDPERVLQRSVSRWELIVAANESDERWAEVYQFLTPMVRDNYPITSYISTKTNFDYDQPTAPKLLKLVDNKAFVSVNATWLAYKNPQVQQAEGGKTLIRAFQSIEEWHWIDDEWYLERPHRENDFYRENPDFFREESSKSPETTSAEDSK